MKTQAAGLKLGREAKHFHICAFLTILVVILGCCSILGTQSVRAQAACTTTQCHNAENYARGSICNLGGHGPLIAFQCPDDPETDDFFFFCNDGYGGDRDCSSFGAPS